MSSGLVSRAWSGWCRVIVIADQGVFWVAPCHQDWFPGRRVGGAVSFGLVRRASCGWRRVIRIGEQGVVWVAPCH